MPKLCAVYAYVVISLLAVFAVSGCKSDLGKLEAHVTAERCPETKIVEVTKAVAPRVQQMCLEESGLMFLVMNVVGTSRLEGEAAHALRRRVLWKVACYPDECRVSQLHLPLDGDTPFDLLVLDVDGQSVRRRRESDGVYSLTLSKGEKLTADFIRGRLVYTESDSIADASGEAVCPMAPDAGTGPERRIDQ